jgi:3D (Asp-Asp-Asp) domain-containing protein
VAAIEDPTFSRRGRALSPLAIKLALCTVATLATIGTAIGAKELQSRTAPPLALVSLTEVSARVGMEPAILPAPEDALPGEFAEPVVDEIVAPESAATAVEIPPEQLKYAMDPDIRWFNGRPARPARVITMTVTGYSPDERSCGPYADGQTATLHSVKTNAMRLVAADPKVLPYGSMMSIPGYDGDQIVPVLDCGGAIKGNKLDLLFATHEEARQWGRKKVRVTVWQYADGLPAENPRTLR